MAGADIDVMQRFRIETRRWLTANYPAELRETGALPDDAVLWGGRRYLDGVDPVSCWRRRLASRGWTAPTWPTAYGGGGLSAAEAAILDEEMAAGHFLAPLISFGVWMLGPVLLEFASEDQKLEHLPPIVRGELRWCQGYSEPGAGSDLASLQTRCEDCGDHYLINGQKVWTTYADESDWLFALVRTESTHKHSGISFVLIDMTSPGIEVRPIKLISGASPFCETFMTDVRVPKRNLIGNPNGGWAIAKRLLQYERQNVAGGMGVGGSSGGVAGDLGDVAKSAIGVTAEGLLANGDLRARIARNGMDMHAFMLTVQRVEDESRSGGGMSAASSIIKYAAASMAQERAELFVEALGHQGLGWDRQGFSAAEWATVRGWLRSKGNSIEGGTSEINLNIVAKRVLGLPDPQ